MAHPPTSQSIRESKEMTMQDLRRSEHPLANAITSIMHDTMRTEETVQEQKVLIETMRDTVNKLYTVVGGDPSMGIDGLAQQHGDIRLMIAENDRKYLSLFEDQSKRTTRLEMFVAKAMTGAAVAYALLLFFGDKIRKVF